MKKLTKKQAEEHAKIVAQLRDAYTAASEFRDEIVSDMQAYADERSEKWQESDAGTEFESWKDTWEGLDIDETVADDFEALPMEVGA